MTLLKSKIFSSPLFKERFSLLVLFLAICFVYYGWFYKPVVGEVVAVKTEVDSLKGEAAKYRAAASDAARDAKRLEEMTAAYEGMKERLLFIKERLPSVKEVSGILREVSSPFPGVTFISVQPSAVEDKGTHMRLPISLQIRGDFPSLGRYISSIEDSRRLIGIENITIGKDAKTGLMIRLELSVYLMPENHYETVMTFGHKEG